MLFGPLSSSCVRICACVSRRRRSQRCRFKHAKATGMTSMPIPSPAMTATRCMLCPGVNVTLPHFEINFVETAITSIYIDASSEIIALRQLLKGLRPGNRSDQTIQGDCLQNFRLAHSGSQIRCPIASKALTFIWRLLEEI